MIKAIIVDDEQHAIDHLSDLILQHFPNQIQIAGTASSVKEGIKAIHAFLPDLVFLDVQLHDRTGFDLLREAGSVLFKVIFTTAFDKFAIQAIKFSAIDYLLKPIDEDDLAEALKKVSNLSKEQTELMTNILETNLQQPRRKKQLTIPSNNELLFFQINDIVRFQSNGSYTTIFKADGFKITVSKVLKEFEDMLFDYDFFRIHNSNFINLHYIKSYNKGKGGSVVLTDGTELEVSTRRKEEFLKRMKAL